MKRILIISRATNSYASLADQPALCAYDIVLDTIESIEAEGVASYITRRVHEISIGRVVIDGVWAATELACTIAALIASQTGLPGPSPQSVLGCQNKYISRQVQHACVQAHTPPFALSREVLSSGDTTFPLFVKPVRGSLSAYAGIVHSRSELEAYMYTMKKNVVHDNVLYGQCMAFGEFSHEHCDTYNELLCESVLEGTQVCVDGYVYNERVVIIGTTRAHFLENSLSFSRWDFPHSFSADIDAQVNVIVQ